MQHCSLQKRSMSYCSTGLFYVIMLLYALIHACTKCLSLDVNEYSYLFTCGRRKPLTNLSHVAVAYVLLVYCCDVSVLRWVCGVNHGSSDQVSIGHCAVFCSDKSTRFWLKLYSLLNSACIDPVPTPQVCSVCR